jgi:hypothetical protein
VLFQKEVQYTEHIVPPEGVTTDPKKLKAMWEWPMLRDRHELKRFLGLCTYYRRFISGCGDIVKSLTRPREEKQPFQQPPEVEATFSH